MNILITGIHGFVGSNLVSALKDQHSIYGLDIVAPAKEGVQKTYNWDELNKIPAVDAVIHLAGKAHDTKNTAAEQDYFDINVGLTKTIFQYFLNSGASKFVIFSSVKAVADTVTGEYLTEDAVAEPKTAYGKSKLEAELYIINEWEKWRQYDGATGRLGEGAKGGIEKKVYILRPCMIHGPGNKGNLNLLYSMQQKGLPWPLGAFENRRSFCSVDNILYVVQQLIEKDIEPGIYNVADDEALSTNELIKIMALSQDRKARIWNIPAGSVRAMAKIGDVLHLPLNSERLKKLTESYVVSNEKIKKALGIAQMPVSAREGLIRTFESFKGK
ncbi:MAG: NAD-dependent epimerase/dehydratase family protein [Bacteroidota bacterium]